MILSLKQQCIPIGCVPPGRYVPSGQGGMYPSMHWARGYVSQHALGTGVCIPACTGQGVYPSMHWAGVCIPACTGQGCVSQHALGRGVCIPVCTGQGCVSQHALGRGVYPSMHWAGGCLPRGWCVSQHALGMVGVCPGGICPGVSAGGGGLPRGCVCVVDTTPHPL